MLVIPVTAGRKKFPFITLGLILINCLVFFLFQATEEDAYQAAYSYSRSSGLLQIEAQQYKRYLQAKNEGLPSAALAKSNSPALFWRMMRNDRFQYELREHILIPPASPQFADWSKKREIFEEKLNESFSWRFGYSPARKNYLAAFTCMFLHGGIMHLAGNMLFLWFVGSLLEIGIGRRYYLCGYLITGVCASLAFGLAYPISQGPLVGASGAIAGLMGAYGLIYGRTRIKVFYSLGFYFDYARIPGWILFPFWLGNEFFQLFTNAGSNVAYMAHLGGLVSGASLAFTYVRVKGNRAAEELEEEESESRVPALLEEGLHHFSELRLPEAREKIAEALEIEPDNRAALQHLYNIDKCAPHNELFHQTATRLLSRQAADRGYDELITSFEEYKRLSGKPRLRTGWLYGLAMGYMRAGNTAEAARFLTLLLKKDPAYSGLPGSLYKLGCMFTDEGKQIQAKKCFQVIVGKYSNTVIAEKAAQRMRVAAE